VVCVHGHSPTASMVVIANQKDARSARDSVCQKRRGGVFDGFCYLCNGRLNDGRPIDRDHIPPRAMFLEADYGQLPLVLQVHRSCNKAHSAEDEIVGQLALALHGPRALPGPDRRGLVVAPNSLTGQPQILLPATHLYFQRVIFGWVRGLHALLYGSYLPNLQRAATHPPTPTSRFLEDGSSMPGFVMPQETLTVAMVRHNRAAGSVDRIVAWNYKLTYECTWTPWSDGPGWLCFWGLRIYDWENLGDPSIHGRRGCSGVFLLEKKPEDATEAKARLTGECPDSSLDPFEACA
jgi:hypothetical protein